MGKPVKLFIVEGEKKERRFVSELANCFFKGRYQAEIITVAAAQNIYMLYEKLRKDEYIDIVELLKEQNEKAGEQLAGISRQDISEVYMFFDHDLQEDNLKGGIVKSDDSSVVREMLGFFDNETENGKLYISYPMSEALYDYQDDYCEAFDKCFVPVSELSGYKKKAGEGNPKAARHFDIDAWRMVLNVFFLRVKCLFGFDELLFKTYRREVSAVSVFDREEELCRERGSVFVLSAFPEFIFDYFKADFWNSVIRVKRYRYDQCEKMD